MKRPEEIVVVSGKGGTGKTSVSAALLYLLADRALGADCDVDASNFPILFKPERFWEEPFFGMEAASVDTETCTGCGRCAEVCRFGAVQMEHESAHIDTASCEGCGYCARICPAQAISLSPLRTGTVKISALRTGNTMIHGDLEIGGENSGKLVARIRQLAMEKARQEGYPLIITDGAPGIGCPVVSSLSGAFFALMVTEPTRSGIHDLERLARTIEGFGIPAGIVINKADLHDENSAAIEALAADLGLPVLARLPFSPSVPGAMKALRTVAEGDNPELTNLLRDLTATLLDRLSLEPRKETP